MFLYSIYSFNLVTVFISHSSDNDDFLEIITKKLAKYNIDYWASEEKIKANNRSVYKTLRNSVKKCSQFILLWSKEAASSKFVRDEINWVTEDLSTDIFVIIIDTNNVPSLPSQVRESFHYKVKKPDDEKMNKAIATIVNHICKLQMNNHE